MDKELREIQVQESKNWSIVQIHNRVDAFNYAELMEKVNGIIKSQQTHLAFDLTRTNFLSLPSIKLMSSLASSLEKEGRQVALLAPSEKIKRQIDIYASLEKLRLFKTSEDLHFI